MPLGSRVLDNGLSVLDIEADRLDVCHTIPTTYAQATSTYSVGNKLTPSIGAPADASPNGRKVTVGAITDGEVTATSTASGDDAQYWALTDTVNSLLLATEALASAQMVTDGNTFTLAAFDIRIPSE